jgi:large repetitive protein
MKRNSVNWHKIRNAACGFVPRWRQGLSFLLVTFTIAALLLLGACKGGSGTTPITLEVSPSAAQTLDEGQVQIFKATLGNDTKNQGVTWTLSGTGCAGAGCGCITPGSGTCPQSSTAANVTYTAPASISATVTASLEAVAVGNKGATVTVSISVVLPPVFTTTTLPNGQNGEQYNQQIVVTGGVAPLAFSVTCPPSCLPQGLTLSQSGIVTGLPSGSGTSNFTVQVTDSGNAVPVKQAFSISIAPAAALSITTNFVSDALNNAMYSAQIATLGGAQPLTWSIIAGALPPNLTLGLHSGVISGTLPNLPGPFPLPPFVFTVQAQDSALPNHQTAKKQLSITVVPPGPLEITTTSLPVGTTATGYNIPLGASGGIPPYTWSLTTGQLPSGLTLDPQAGVISGTPILAGTSSFTLQLEDSQSTKTTQALSIKVNGNATSNLSLLSGAYSFLFRGFDKTKSSTGSVVIAGAFTADGAGKISAGTEDSNREGGVSLGSTISLKTPGTYTLGSDGRGTITWTVTNGFGAVRNETYDFVLLSDGSGRFFETDTTGTQGSGIFKFQSSTSLGAGNFGGNYAFGFSGQDLAGKPTAFAGTFTADGSSNLNSGTADFNDGGVFDGGVAGSQLTLTGIFSITGTFNRGETNFVFQLPGGPAQVTLLYVFYFVSPSDMFYVAIDTTDATHPRLSGEMIFQPTTTVFDRTALSGAAIATGSGVDTNASVFAGVLQSDGIGHTTLTFDQNDGGGISLQQSSGNATYSVLPNGRVTFTGLGPRVGVAYLTDKNQGFLIGTDAAATLGQLEEQSDGPSFFPISIDDGYTLSAPVPMDNQVLSVLGQVVSDGAANLTGIVDEAGQGGTTTSDQALTAKYTVESNGRGGLTVTSSTTGLPPNLILYVVSPGNFRAISVTPSDQHPEVFFFDH